MQNDPKDHQRKQGKESALSDKEKFKKDDAKDAVSHMGDKDTARDTASKDKSGKASKPSESKRGGTEKS